MPTWNVGGIGENLPAGKYVLPDVCASDIRREGFFYSCCEAAATAEGLRVYDGMDER